MGFEVGHELLRGLDSHLKFKWGLLVRVIAALVSNRYSGTVFECFDCGY